MNKRILQIRTDALVAECLYTKKLKRLGFLSITITALTVIVPIFLTTSLLIAKGTTYEAIMNLVSIVFSATLLSLSILALLLKMEQKRENYVIGRRLNIDVGNDALELLEKDDSELSWFYKYISKQDSFDLENLGDVSEKERKKAYLYSLKKLLPGRSDTICPICNASPFIFKDGSCQVCGNTPKEITNVSN